MKTLAALLCLAATAAFAVQESKPQEISAVKASGIAWKHPEGMPEGVMVSHVSGDAKQGPIVDLIKFPAGTRVGLHWHSANHVVVVLSGALIVGTEGTPEGGKGMEVEAGGYYTVPAKSRHWTAASKETIIAVHGDAPNDLHLVEGGAGNPKK